jgi:hypothetical protein
MHVRFSISNKMNWEVLELQIFLSSHLPAFCTSVGEVRRLTKTDPPSFLWRFQLQI